MKVGDLVHHISRDPSQGEVGIVVENIEKKVWRSHIQGKKVDWNKVEPEPHAVVLFNHNKGTIDIPWCELAVIVEE